MSLHQRYIEQLQKKGFSPDPHQESVVVSFERLVEALQRKQGTSGWLWFKRNIPVEGIYLWGGVGRGKTWLMDLFFQHAREVGIERHHFHSFMRQIHQRLRQREGESAPLELIAAEMAQRMRVLCLDEFNVIDIGDAMLMRNLLEALERQRITLVTTSNQAPDDLYRNGLQRDSFLPAIEILKRSNQVIELSGDKDFRLQLFETSSVYHAPLNEASNRQMNLEFDRLTNESLVLNGCYEVPGGAIQFIKRAGGVIWCDFHALCGPPRWQNDYLELARSHHAVFISGIPHLGADSDDSARRFINLIDVFYDRKVKLVVSAEMQPHEIYGGKRLEFEFQRTASRLKEMQSTVYLKTPHLG
ncbi:MAG: cell division protein ZapE [Candidatus Thiodiazotropha sp.]